MATLILATIAALLVPAGPASAHGPCLNCLEPSAGPPGTLVQVAPEGVLAVWNPRPNMLALGVPGSSKECDIACARAKPMYHYDEPVVVLAEERPRAPLSFTVPDAPLGRYLVVIYNGSESGHHYTWDFFTVEPTPILPKTVREAGTGWGWVGVAVVGSGAIFGAGYLIGRRRRVSRLPVN
ncbi:MAG: hypothetical protein GEU71_17145 [Actinobacteria bacterium]|nr:hypothetical protein [Actinomycetota bacterium]